MEYIYESPITIYTKKPEIELEDAVMNIVYSWGIDIDKERLIKALKFDREQYDVGYKHGRAVGFEELLDKIYEVDPWLEGCVRAALDMKRREDSVT